MSGNVPLIASILALNDVSDDRKDFVMLPSRLHVSARVSHLTRIRRENPAFNYGFFRPNPLAFEREAGKNAGHGGDFTGPGSPGQAEIARSGSGRDSAQTF